MQRSLQIKYLLISITIHVYNEAVSWISPWKRWDLESFFPSWPRVSQGSMSLHWFAGRIGQEGTWFLLDVCRRCCFLTAVCSLMWRWQFGVCMCVFGTCGSNISGHWEQQNKSSQCLKFCFFVFSLKMCCWLCIRKKIPETHSLDKYWCGSH